MIDPGSFWVGFSAGAIVVVAMAWKMVRRAVSSEARLERDHNRDLEALQFHRAEKEALRTLAAERAADAMMQRTHAIRQRVELAKLNRAIRRRNRKIANLRIGGDPKREGTPANDVAGPRVASSPKVGGDRSRSLLLSGESVNSTAARGQISPDQG